MTDKTKSRYAIVFVGAPDAGLAALAAAFAAAHARKDVVVHHAGVGSGHVDPLVWRVLSECQLSPTVQAGLTLPDFGGVVPDVVVTLGGQAEAACAVVAGNPLQVHWRLEQSGRSAGSQEQQLKGLREHCATIKRLVEDLFEHGYLDAFLQARSVSNLILDHMTEGVIAHDLQRRIFYFNAAAEAITGYRREAVLNRDCHDVIPSGLCGGKCSFCDGSEPRSVRPERREIEIATATGDCRRIAMNINPMTGQDGKAVGVLACFRDMTRETQLARRLGEIEHFAGIVGKHPSMLALYDLIPELADSSAPVLIQGESGTGKELVAAALHNEGPRGVKMFIPVNCGALPEGLLESELFGHVKGAFTGAIRDKKGRFELADGGTIFLDEIGDISPAMQVKLLRVLQEGTFERVGSEKTIKVDVRVISATHRDLRKEMAAGKFREDLFYRLSVVPLMVPPLRDRPTDIPLLANHFLKRFANGKPVRFSPEAMDFMLGYAWPGNVRELQNWIQFALIKCKTGVIEPAHLPPIALKAVLMPQPAVTGIPSSPLPTKGRQRLTRETVHDAIVKAGGNKLAAAKFLGVSRATLYRFMDETDGAGPDTVP